MKKFIQNLKINKDKIKNKLSILSGTIVSTFIMAESKVYADSNTESIDGFITFACDWLTKIRRSSCSCWRSDVCSWLAT